MIVGLRNNASVPRGIEPLIFGFYAPMPYRWTTEGSIVSWLVAYVFNISGPNELKSCKEMWAILAKKAFLSLCSSFLFSGFSWFSAGLYHWLHETRGEDTIHWWKRALESVNKNKPGTTASKEGEVLSFFIVRIIYYDLGFDSYNRYKN